MNQVQDSSTASQPYILDQPQQYKYNGTYRKLPTQPFM